VRKLAIAAAVSLSLSGVSHALGLGEIEMYSALNQTLDAEIEILSATDEELNSMQVRLASPGAFARAGLIQLPVLSSVRFSVDRRPDGKPVVKIISDGEVVEPFLNFLIEVDAPGAVTLVREYTVLLDPPTFASQPAAPSNNSVATYVPTEADNNAVNAIGTEGVFIDLNDATVSTDALGESAAEVTFTVTSSESVAADTSTLFVPDAELISSAGTAVVDRGGEVISLEQELNITPEFDQTTSLTADTSSVNAGELIALDNLGAQGESGAPIFDREFDTGSSELISSDELKSLVVTETGNGIDGRFTETTVDDFSQFANAPSSVQTISDSDADGLAVGDLIDLSGIVASDDTFSNSSAIEGFTDSPDLSVSGDSYRVQPQDTLWRIANQTKARGVTPHQMMVALLNANPSAFAGGNMNRLSNGAVLSIPTEASQRSIDPAEAFARVQSWTRDNAANIPPAPTNYSAPVDNSFPVEPAPTAETVVFERDNTINEIIIRDNSTVTNSLEDVNRRMEQARDDLANETIQRDELRGRVNSLESNMEQMKDLITLRESQLSELENEVANTESMVSNGIDDELQAKLDKDLADAQSAIERKADIETNLVTAQAEAQAIRLSTEEDALRAQLAALEIEKRDLAASSQPEKAELVRQAEAEKTAMLQQAQNERQRVMAGLDSEKARIARDAELELAEMKNGAGAVGQNALANVQNERNRLAAETTQMQNELADMEAEKTRLLETAESNAAIAEQEAKDAKMRAEAERERLAEEAANKMADAEPVMKDTESAMKDTESAMKDTESAMKDTDADGTLSNIAADGKEMMGEGADKMSGLLGTGPLGQGIGDRKTVLGIGAGLSLLGLLGAWALRRRGRPEEDNERMLQPRADVRRPAPAKTNFDDRKTMYGENDAANAPVQRTAVDTKEGESSTQGAGAIAAAAAAGTAAVVSRDKNDADNNTQASGAQSPVVEPSSPKPPIGEMVEPVNEVDIEDTALDDTITEAEVYQRYGLHGQAEDLLKTAIKRSPENEEYHFKLLENYHDQKNAEDFNACRATFEEKFTNTEHTARIAEMARDLNGDAASTAGGDVSQQGSDVSSGALGAVAAGAAGVAGVASAAGSGIVGKGKDTIAGVGSMLDRKQDEVSGLETGAEESLLDQTIDPGDEFSMDELQATGDLNALQGDVDKLEDHGGMALDDVDLASLDDDGTMNLEDIAGAQMSGADLGSLDLTNTDTSFDELSLDDAEMTSLAGIKDNTSSLESEFPIEGAGGSDEMETMLDLAKAYMDMGDNSNAEKALKDIASRGNSLQQAEAAELLKKLS